MTDVTRKSVFKDIARGDAEALHRAVDMVSYSNLEAAPPEKTHDYARYVSKMAERRDGESFFNRSASHVVVATEVLFAHAVSVVEILTGRFDIAIYGAPRVVEAAIAFLRGAADRRIDILSEDIVDVEFHPMLKAIGAEDLLNRVSLSVVPISVLAEFDFRFLVSDSRDYRFQSRRASLESIVQFGSVSEALKLHEVFSRLKAISSVENARAP